MHNRLLTHLSGYVNAVFRDIAYAYLQPREMVRDKARLLHELGVNGLRIVTIDLPALCKHLDRCLDEQLYTPSGLRLGACKAVKVPVFLRDLYLQVFDSGGSLLECPSIDAIAALRQLMLGLKRLRVKYREEGLRNEIDDFISVEANMRSPDLDWSSDRRLSDVDHHRLSFDNWVVTDRERVLARALARTCDVVSASLGSFDAIGPEGTGLPSRHGPGVVADLSRQESKYSFRDWPDKLDQVFPYDLYGCSDLGSGKLVGHELPYRNREVPSRMIAVPKEHSKPRLIAAEPSAHQWCQQSVRSWLEDAILRCSLKHCISFRDQSPNQHAAIAGSRDGSLATIDLSSASDRLSCALVERAFRANPTFLDALHACRTRWLRYEHPLHGVNHLRLKKFAPMGSAVTFPVQSVVYAMCAIAAILIEDGLHINNASVHCASKKVRVFGDDIVVPAGPCRLTLEEILTFVGMKVNRSKTFGNLLGRFRESCGVDSFKGYNVTPARLLNLPNVSAPCAAGALIEQANNFFEKGMWNTAEWVASHLRDYRKVIPIVHVASGALGLTSFVGTSLGHLSKRFNGALMSDEYKVLVPAVKQEVLETDGPLTLFQWFTESHDPRIPWVPGIRVRVAAKVRLGWRGAIYFN